MGRPGPDGPGVENPLRGEQPVAVITWDGFAVLAYPPDGSPPLDLVALYLPPDFVGRESQEDVSVAGRYVAICAAGSLALLERAPDVLGPSE